MCPLRSIRCVHALSGRRCRRCESARSFRGVAADRASPTSLVRRAVDTAFYWVCPVSVYDQRQIRASSAGDPPSLSIWTNCTPACRTNCCDAILWCGNTHRTGSVVGSTHPLRVCASNLASATIRLVDCIDASSYHLIPIYSRVIFHAVFGSPGTGTSRVSVRRTVPLSDGGSYRRLG